MPDPFPKQPPRYVMEVENDGKIVPKKNRYADYCLWHEVEQHLTRMKRAYEVYGRHKPNCRIHALVRPNLWDKGITIIPGSACDCGWLRVLRGEY